MRRRCLVPAVLAVPLVAAAFAIGGALATASSQLPPCEFLGETSLALSARGVSIVTPGRFAADAVDLLILRRRRQ